MDKIINVLLLIIIFVFDPLAISLVITSNFAFSQAYPKKKYKENLYGEFEEDDPWNDLDDELPEPNEEVKEVQKQIIIDMMEADEASGLYNEEENDKRMEIIGQNGNDGEHYNEHIPKQEYNTNNQKLDSYNLTSRDGKKLNLENFINNFKTPTIKDDETKTY